jgi:hypothetical protein
MALVNFIVLLAILAVVALAEERVSYKGYKVRRCIPTTDAQVTNIPLD